MSRLTTRMREAFRKLMGYDEPAGGIVPDYRPAILNHPFKLDPLSLDYAKAVRLISTVRVCVLQKAMDAASRPLLVERQVGTDWEPVERMPGNVVDVLHAGNPRQAGREVIRDWHANFYTHGNGYLVAETFGGRQVKELWVVPSHLVEVIPGERRMPKLYVFSRGGKQEAIPAENVIAWHDFQPEDDPIGASALASVQMQYETRYDLMRLFQKVIRNGGVGAGYFKVPQTNGSPTVLTEADKEAIQKSLRRLRGQGDRDVVLDVLDFVKMGLTMPELQFIENTKLADADICNALGVPPWMVGISDGGKLGEAKADAQTQERLYWTKLQSELEIRDAILTERLGPMFREKNIRFRADMTGVLALAMPILNAAQQAVALSGRAPLTVNELRRIVGLQRIDDESADELYEAPAPSFGAAPAIGSDTPEPEPAPVEEKKGRRLIDTPERAERWRQKDTLMRRYEGKFQAALKAMLAERKALLLRKLETEGLRALANSPEPEPVAVPAPELHVNVNVERQGGVTTKTITFERGPDGELRQALVNERTD